MPWRYELREPDGNVVASNGPFDFFSLAMRVGRLHKKAIKAQAAPAGAQTEDQALGAIKFLFSFSLMSVYRWELFFHVQSKTRDEREMKELTEYGGWTSLEKAYKVGVNACAKANKESIAGDGQYVAWYSFVITEHPKPL